MYSETTQVLPTTEYSWAKTAFNKFVLGEKSVLWHKNKLQRAFLHSVLVRIIYFVHLQEFQNYLLQMAFLKLLQQWKGRCWFKSSFLYILEAIMYVKQMTQQSLNVYWDSQTFQGKLSGPHLFQWFWGLIYEHKSSPLRIYVIFLWKLNIQFHLVLDTIRLYLKIQ